MINLSLMLNRCIVVSFGLTCILACTWYFYARSDGRRNVTQLLKVECLLVDDKNMEIWLQPGTYYFAIYIPIMNECKICSLINLNINLYDIRNKMDNAKSIYTGQANIHLAPLPVKTDIWLSMPEYPKVEIEKPALLPYPWTYAEYWKSNSLMPNHLKGLLRLEKQTRLRVNISVDILDCLPCVLDQGWILGIHSFVDAI